jgi:sugar phosphate isomerase/epimerase
MRPGKKDKPMNIGQVAIQLYTLRERMKSREDIESTLKRVKEIGYPAIQISGLNWDFISEAEMVALCDELGLTICATHESAGDVIDHPEKIVERLSALGCKYTAYPYPGGVDFGDEKAVADLIAGLNRAGKMLTEAGQVLTYHNHHIEFRKLNGRMLLERIYEETDPTFVQGEIDTYWVQYGGGDPAAWCRKLKNRLPLLHLKDYRINSENEIEFCEIGSGTLDFKQIISDAEASGCEWFIVEQDTCSGDEFDSIEQSFSYIKSYLVVH